MNKMNKNIFDDPLLIEQSIEESLLKMKSLEDRGMLREILTGTFLPLYKRMEASYKALEKRLEKEQQNFRGDFSITTGIVERERFDPTLDNMYPMVPADLEEREIDSNAILKAIQEKASFYLYPVFIAADYLTLKELETGKRRFFGTLRTDYGEYQGQFRLEKEPVYIRMLEELYGVFRRNGVMWDTVCAPYLNKIFRVCLTESESIPEEEIQEIKIDFEELSPAVVYRAVPVWNVRTVREKTSAYPEACVDKIYYQHTIYRHRLNKERDYLIMDEGMELTQVRRLEGDLLITCDETLPRKWSLLEFCHDPWSRMTFPSMENREKPDVFIDRNAKVKRMRTLGEMNRFLTALGYIQELELKDVVISHDIREEGETYSMDQFAEEEVCIGDSPYILQFLFRAGGETKFYTRDLMSYLVTRLQNEYPEYRCVGKLIG